MTRLFAVLRDYGPGVVSGQPLEAQPKWPAHARFMDDLKAEGAVLLAGPLGDAEDALLIMRAADAAEIERRLADDPWTANGVLVTRRIAPWTLRIGALV
ncbi:MAG: YciI family protein [Pseudomonadota bacterium]|nr:YciI family protein [Pseudomonadota bacterium]